jgi:hypothetical protein
MELAEEGRASRTAIDNHSSPAHHSSRRSSRQGNKKQNNPRDQVALTQGEISETTRDTEESGSPKHQHPWDPFDQKNHQVENKET